MLTGLRGVGKTVLLNALRSAAVRAGWGTGKLEARPDQRCAARSPRPLHQAVRELGHRQGGDGRPRARHHQGVRAARAGPRGPARKLRDRWQPGIDVPAVTGRADSGDIEIDLVELLTDIGGLAADVGKGVAIFIDEMQDLGPDDVSALCAACHEISQSGLPVIVVGAGLPHLPAVLSASKSYSREAVPLLAHRPARPRRRRPRPGAARPRTRAPSSPPRRSTRCMPRPPATPTSSRPTARSSGTSRRSPMTAEDVAVAAPEAESELAVGFFGSRFERATPAEREYLRAMADVAVELGVDETDAGADRRRRGAPGAQAAVALAGPRRPDQEGPDLLRRARPDRLHRAALRPLPARARLSPERG